MPVTARMPDPLRSAGWLSPVIFSLGDPDLLVELLSANPAGVVLVEASPDLPVVFANESFQRWAPLASGPVVGANLPQLFEWADRAGIRATYREVIRSGRPTQQPVVPYRRGGGPDAATGLRSATHYPLRGPRGQVTHVLSFTTEVGPVAPNEREAASLQQQIEQSIQLEQLKADFLRLASHELRGPIAIVRGYLSMIEDGTLGAIDESVAEVLPLLRAKLEEMNQLINEMLETARLDDSALQLRLAPLDLREIVREAAGALQPLAASRHHLVVTAPPGPVSVLGDRARLAMVLTNLVHNAIKYSPDGGEVRVACAIEGPTAAVRVTDQGVGIAEADRDRLFARFGRIVTERTAGIPGTGLGLYLAQDLARRHGGDVELVSQPGRGSTFTLRLPLAGPATGG